MIVSTFARFGSKSGRDAWNEYLDAQALKDQQAKDKERREKDKADNNVELTSEQIGKLYSDGCTFSSCRKSFIA